MEQIWNRFDLQCMQNSLCDISLDFKEDVLFNKFERGLGIFIYINEKSLYRVLKIFKFNNLVKSDVENNFSMLK